MRNRLGSAAIAATLLFAAPPARASEAALDPALTPYTKVSGVAGNLS